MVKRLIRLTFGLFLYALGTVITMKGNVGFAPWEVFHSGVAMQTGLTIGTVSILTGLVICVIVIILGEKLGLGTILNMLLIGIFIDIIQYLDPFVQVTNIFVGFALLILGMFIIAVGTYFYISTELGAGPRDSMMVMLQRKTGIKVGIARFIFEATVVVIGWILGGQVGVGTVLAAFTIGFCVEIVFKVFRFDATKIKHETLADMYKAVQHR